MSIKLMRYDELVPCKFVMSIYIKPRLTRKTRALEKAIKQAEETQDDEVALIIAEEMDKQLELARKVIKEETNE